jgi:hypothetical protein
MSFMSASILELITHTRESEEGEGFKLETKFVETQPKCRFYEGCCCIIAVVPGNSWRTIFTTHEEGEGRCTAPKVETNCLNKLK